MKKIILFITMMVLFCSCEDSVWSLDYHLVATGAFQGINPNNMVKVDTTQYYAPQGTYDFLLHDTIYAKGTPVKVYSHEKGYSISRADFVTAKNLVWQARNGLLLTLYVIGGFVIALIAYALIYNVRKDAAVAGAIVLELVVFGWSFNLLIGPDNSVLYDEISYVGNGVLTQEEGSKKVLDGVSYWVSTEKDLSLGKEMLDMKERINSEYIVYRVGDLSYLCRSNGQNKYGAWATTLAASKNNAPIFHLLGVLGLISIIALAFAVVRNIGRGK